MGVIRCGVLNAILLSVGERVQYRTIYIILTTMSGSDETMEAKHLVILEMYLVDGK
jgi:hypothetical protein